MRRRHAVFALLALPNLALGAVPASGADWPDPWVFGVKLRVGGRYDNVRRCVATSAGTPGGPAADISVFAEAPAGDGRAVHIDLPVMRPILFATAFHMLQFEPTVTLKFRDKSDASVGWVLGPTLGVALHYGPDYRSELDGPKFFAIGPIIGGYAGLDFRRPGETFNVELGMTPYVIPLFGVSDPASHRGIVVGGLFSTPVSVSAAVRRATRTEFAARTASGRRQGGRQSRAQNEEAHGIVRSAYPASEPPHRGEGSRPRAGDPKRCGRRGLVGC